MKEATATPTLKSSCVICESARLHYLFSVSGYRVVRCDDCGLLLTNPQPSDEELERLYGEGYFLSGNDEAEQSRIAELKQESAGIYLDLIERYRGPGDGAKLLEIGSGHGDLLVRAASRGWSVTGVEYSAHACKVAERKLEGRSNAQVICGEITDLPGEGLYDVCALSDVIEHVRNPRLFLERVHHLLKPGGVVLIATPSLDSWSARLLRNRWMELKGETSFLFQVLDAPNSPD